MTSASVSTIDLSSRAPPLGSPTSGSELSLPVRRPPSVSSRSTATRRHRSNRSHSGGSSYRPQNEFPNFERTGDVEIVINVEGQERRYLLHRLILSQCSGFFEAGTSEDWSRSQAQIQSAEDSQSYGHSLARIGEEDRGVTTRSASLPLPQKTSWRYELDEQSPDDEIPMLVQKVGSSILRKEV